MSGHYFAQRGLVLGFHGCERELGEALIAGAATMEPSSKTYDWLGEGRYFWENDPQRALDWAKQRGKKDPFVLGAVVDLGACFNLLESRFLETLQDAYNVAEEVNGPLPENQNPPGVDSADKVVRYRDCIVVRHAIWMLEDDWGVKFDSVRGAFLEGPRPYDGAGFRTRNHVQLCIRNPNCIKGYFREQSRDEAWDAV